MKIHTILKFLTLLAVTFCSIEAFAYEDDKKKDVCRNPKVQEFTLPEYVGAEKKEAPAEADFSFIVSGWSDPKKIKLLAKDQPIPFTVESTDTFHKVKAKLPAALTGKVIRINARIPALLGCYTSMGWLIKVAGTAGSEAPATINPVAPAVQNSVLPPPASSTPILENQQNIQNAVSP